MTDCNLTNRNVLITGCSFSADAPHSGWHQKNQHKHYSKILEKTHRWQIANLAAGGCSNREIALRTVEHCLKHHYDLCIIQWTSLHRLWIYEADCNVDLPTMILPSGVFGWGDLSTALKFSKTFRKHYLNDYMAIKHWLLDQIMVQSYLKKHNINYVFVRGCSNYIHEIEALCQSWPLNNISEIQLSKPLKEILNFDNNSDNYVYDKLLSIINIYKSIDKDNCIGYTTGDGNYGLPSNFHEFDRADDGVHPGTAENLFLANSITDFCKKKGVLF